MGDDLFYKLRDISYLFIINWGDQNAINNTFKVNLFKKSKE